MAVDIGPRIGIDGEKEFRQQVGNINQMLRTLNSEMKAVTSEFDDNEKSQESLTKQADVLTRQIEAQEKKLELLTRGYDLAADALGDADTKTLKWAQSVQDATADLNKMRGQLKKVEDGVEDLGDTAEDSVGSFDGLKNIGQKLAAGFAVSTVIDGVKELGQAVFDLEENTREYRKIMGTLEVSSEAAGYTAEQTSQAYKRLYSVIGESQAVATTVANLQAINLEQEDLMEVIDQVIGAWATYGDSIPIDGLAEAINETIQTGQVTGSFADVLNWAGASEDAFNEKLQAANSSTERANLVLQSMAEQGLAEAGQAWLENNDAIVKTNESQARYEEALARIGDQLSPVTDGLRDLATEGLGLLGNAIDVVSDVWNWLNTPIDWTMTEKGYESLTETIEDTTEAIEDATKAKNAEADSAGLLAEQLQKITENAEETESATLSLTAAQDMLTDALDEQAESGALSVDTTLKLIDAGYAAALAIDEETGAITLNRAAYIQIAQAKLDDQIASLETQRQSVQNALAMKDEALIALDLGKSYLNAAEARTALEGQEKSFSVQIAALEKLKNSLGSYTYVSQRAARTTVSTSEKAQTQAEKDLVAFKKLKATLDHEKAIDEVDEKEYYARLADYRNRYLTDDSNLDDYRKVTEEIYKYDQKLAEEESKLWEEQTENLISELEDRVDSVLDERDKMAQNLAGYRELFEIKDDKMVLADIQDQIEALNEYGDVLARLRERSISDSLMDEILGMSPDDAADYGEQLLNMSDEQWDEYNTLWEEKQKRAKEIAAQFYQDQLDVLKTEYDDKLGEALNELTGTAFASGKDTAQGLIDGLSAKESELYFKAQSIANEVSRILSSSHAVSGEVDGSHALGLSYVPWDGYIAELHKGEMVLTSAQAEALKSYMASGIQADNSGLSNLGAGIVNGIQTAMSGMNSGGNFTFNLVLPNGEVLARYQLPSLIDVARASGTPILNPSVG